MTEPGPDLHEWETQWHGFQLDEPVMPEGDDADNVRDFLAARELAAADLREIHDYIAQDRAAP